jgi:hypothetical protein
MKKKNEKEREEEKFKRRLFLKLRSQLDAHLLVVALLVD